MRQLTSVIVLFALLLGTGVPGFAQDADAPKTTLSAAQTAEAEAFIKGKHNKVRAVLRAPGAFRCGFPRLTGASR